MNPDERQPADDVQARTTPGTDPRVEELRREQEGRDERPLHSEQLPIENRPVADDREGRAFDPADREGRAFEPTDREGRAFEPTDRERGDQPAGVMSSELAGYRERMSEAQARFIDDPRAALQEAGTLVKEAIDRVMHQAAHGEGTDTEQMRVAMQRYRRLLETIAEPGR